MIKQILKVPVYALVGVIVAVGLTGYGVAKVFKPAKKKQEKTTVTA
jgi:hypothetical protein